MNNILNGFPQKVKAIVPLCEGVNLFHQYDGAIMILEEWSGKELHSDRSIRSEQLNISWYFLMYLEMALQNLINLDIIHYNKCASVIGLEQIPYKFYSSLKEIV